MCGITHIGGFNAEELVKRIYALLDALVEFGNKLGVFSRFQSRDIKAVLGLVGIVDDKAVIALFLLLHRGCSQNILSL